MSDLPDTPPYDAVIKHDFAGGEGLLAVQVGDTVRVTHDAGTGWLHGAKTDGAVGWLPKSYAGPVPPAAPPPAASPPPPQWYSEQDSGWTPFNPEDSALIELKYAQRGPTGSFTTVHFSFNAQHRTVYRVEFASMVQVNTQSNTRRSIRREPQAPLPPHAAPSLVRFGMPWRPL